MQNLDLQPTLSGRLLRLRPLMASDFESLYQAASDPMIWEQHPDSLRYQREVFLKYFESGMASRGALIVIDLKSNAVIGSSRFYDYEEKERTLCIGYTFLRRDYWRKGFNSEMKRLMLTHAFTWARHVDFQVGERNLRSRTAMERLGGVRVPNSSELETLTRPHVTYRLYCVPKILLDESATD